MKKIFASVTLAAFMLVGSTAFAYTQDPPPADMTKKKAAPKKKKTTTAKAEPTEAKPTPTPKAAPKKK
jgi:hypothetical protein